MQSVQFCFWLQGFFELTNPKEINEEQTEMIKKHLALVFFHEIDPSHSSNPVIQEKLNNIHHGESQSNKNNEKPGYDQTLYRC